MKTRFFALLFAAYAVAMVLLASPPARAQMSDTERKSAARAAYTEGVKLQDDGKYAEALVRFESAQKFFDAPTHLLHIAECQALSGRLVEASETYELLTRRQLPPGSPDAFVQAQQQGQAELPALKARVPTLRVNVKPDPSTLHGLQVNVNGVSMPNELLGIARPLNPGVYRFSAVAQGWGTQAPIDIPLGEKEQKTIDLTLVQRAGGPVAAPPPVASGPTPPPPPYPDNPDQTRPQPKAADGGPTSAGLLLGVRGGAIIPAGTALRGAKMDAVANAGGGFGIDAYARLAKMLLLGGTFEYGSLSAPTTVLGASGTFSSSASTTYIGLALGIVPNIDKVSFIGDVGIGSRNLTATSTPVGTATGGGKDSLTGLEFGFGVGLSIPAGPIRIVPKASFTLGSFSSLESSSGNSAFNGDIPSANREGHSFIFVGVAIYYSLGFGPKPGTTPAAASVVEPVGPRSPNRL